MTLEMDFGVVVVGVWVEMAEVDRLTVINHLIRASVMILRVTEPRQPEIPVSVFMMSELLIYVSFWDAENFNRIGQKFKLNYLP